MKKLYLLIMLIVTVVSLNAQPILIKTVSEGSHAYTGTSNLLFYLSAGSDTLYRSDGTTAGTFPIKSGFNNARLLTPVGSRLYFIDDSGSENRLWTSTGTAASTIMLGTFSEIDHLAAFGSQLVFSAVTASGQEPWKSNGTLAGTMLIKDINPGPSNSLTDYMNFATVGSYVYFAADNGINGIELWKSDGTNTGTTLVKDITAGPESSIILKLIKVGNYLFFDTFNFNNYSTSLWRSSGTDTSTIIVYTFPPEYSDRSQSIDINGILYFTLSGVYGTLPWKSDGTAAGTIPMDFRSADSEISTFNANGNLVITTVTEDRYCDCVRWELYYNNGITNGFTMIDAGYSNHNITTLGNYVFYDKDQGDILNEVVNYRGELAQTTVPNVSINFVKDLYSYLNTSYDNARDLTVIGNTLYFTSNSHTSFRYLYKYTPSTFGINAFTLVNSSTDTDLRPLKNGDTIYTDQHVNIRANTFGTVGSVRFLVNDHSFNLESSIPFALAGDNNGNYNEWMKPSGLVKITAIPYTGTGATGTAGTPAIFTVRVLSPSDTMISFTLVNAVTDSDIGPLVNGQVINLESLTTNMLNIRANSSFPGTESVVFNFDGTVNFRTENTPPYALFGDVNGDYNSWKAQNGTHTLTATPYTGNSGTGTAGPGKTISFTIINSAARIAMESYPNPAEDHVVIKISDSSTDIIDVIVSDLSGKKYFEGPMKLESGNLILPLNNLNMVPGIYAVKIISEGGTNWIKFLKK